MQIENSDHREGVANAPFPRHIIDISKIESQTKEQLIVFGRVKAIYQTLEVQKLILDGAISKDELINKLKPKEYSKSGHVYILFQNFRREANILVKCEQQHLSIGDLYLFVGGVCKLHQNLLCLEGAIRKMSGDGHQWGRYLKLLSDFKPIPINGQDVAEIDGEVVQTQDAIEIQDD